MYNKDILWSPHPSSISLKTCLSLFYVAVSLVIPVPAYTLSADIRAKNIERVQEYSSEQASFGPAFQVLGVSGLLIEAKPLNACQPIESAPSSQIDTYEYFALIEQGGCDFENKVYFAQSAHFDGVIVFNNKDNKIYQMQGNGHYNIEIPSTFLGKDAGLDLLQNFTWKEKNFAIINANVFIKGEFLIPLKCYLIPFVVIVGVCFLIMLLFVLFKLVRDHRAKLKNRLSRRGLKKLPTRKWKKGCEECVDWESCAICLEDYEDGHKLRVLPCHHAFHCKCIDPWLTETRRVCPLCKRRINPRGQLEDPTPPSSPNPSTYNGNNNNNDEDGGEELERTYEANEHDRDLSTSAPDFLSAARQSASRARRMRSLRQQFHSNSAYEQDEDASDDSGDDDVSSCEEETYDVNDDCPLLNAAPESSANERRRQSVHSSSSDSGSSRSSFRSGGALSRVFQGLVNLKGGMVAQNEPRSAQQAASNVADTESNVGSYTAKNGRHSAKNKNTRTSQHLESQNAESEDTNDVKLLLAGGDGEKCFEEPGPSSALLVQVDFRCNKSNGSSRSSISSCSTKSGHSTEAVLSTQHDVKNIPDVSSAANAEPVEEGDDSSSTDSAATTNEVLVIDNSVPPATETGTVDCDVKLLET